MDKAAPSNAPSAAERGMDRRLLLAVFLPPLAAGINIVVGYSVAHHVCNSGYKTSGYLVSLIDFILCGAAAWLANDASRQLGEADETQPEQGRRLFMAKMGLALAAFAAIVVLASTLVMVTLRPCD